jgi:AcrR family transcriptional regulator
MGRSAASKAEKEPLSHNLLGQRLGRKGRDTRERIIAATERLLAGPPGTVISLSAVSREASLAQTTLYLYFSDLTELLLAVMEPIMAFAEESYIGKARVFWRDETLAQDCLEFVQSFHAFWARHTRILHLRNFYADSHDERMRLQRQQSSEPLIVLLARQMEIDASRTAQRGMVAGAVLLTGVERMITIATEEDFLSRLQTDDPVAYLRMVLEAEAHLLELCIRDSRTKVRAAAAAGL